MDHAGGMMGCAGGTMDISPWCNHGLFGHKSSSAQQVRCMIGFMRCMIGACGTPAECDSVVFAVPTLRIGLISHVPAAQNLRIGLISHVPTAQSIRIGLISYVPVAQRVRSRRHRDII